MSLDLFKLRTLLGDRGPRESVSVCAEDLRILIRTAEDLKELERENTDAYEEGKRDGAKEAREAADTAYDDAVYETTLSIVRVLS